MQLKVWTPFLDLERDMRRFMERFPSEEARTIRPTIDMRRQDGDLVVTVELAGIDPEKDLDITIEDDVLLIKGQKTEETESKDEDRFIRERRYGSFERRIALPDGVEPNNVKASYDNGVLTVKVPVPTPSQPQPHRVQISRGGSGGNGQGRAQSGEVNIETKEGSN
ncbi:MAG TPA: Hsp20/alpha crystallin family protein [Acidimicrobiia bacterium]|nr:Hsp20/alpha crystallin family protein [Acidimicrobiia bacterium]